MPNVPGAAAIKAYADAQKKAEEEAAKKKAAPKLKTVPTPGPKLGPPAPPAVPPANPATGTIGTYGPPAPTAPVGIPPADPTTGTIGTYGPPVPSPSNPDAPPVISDPRPPGAPPQIPGSSVMPDMDYSSYLNDFAIDDAGVKAKINEIFRSTSDIEQAKVIAISYIRGTQWYANQYPGIFEAMAKGLVSNEKDYRSQLNSVDQLYKQYYGRGVSTTEFSSYIKKGENVSLIAKRLEGGAITDTLLKTNPGLSAYFNEGDIAKIGATKAGLSSADGMYLSGLYDYASQLQPLYSQYGKALDKQGLESLYTSNTDAGTVGKRLAGDAYIGANQNQLQYAAGNFGEGQLTQSELKALGEQQAGIDTPLGNQIAQRVARAQQRISRVFDGVLASPSLTAQNGRLRSSQGARPDIGA